MLGIDGDRNDRYFRAEVGTQSERDVRQLCRLHQARPRTRGIDEIDYQRLALERRERDRVAILINQLGVSENARGGRAAVRVAMTSTGSEKARRYCYNDYKSFEITVNTHICHSLTILLFIDTLLAKHALLNAAAV